MKLHLWVSLITIISTFSIAQQPVLKETRVYDVTKSPYNVNPWDPNNNACDAAIQSAINDAAAAGSWGSVIYFPNGRYFLSKPLLVGTGVADSPKTDGMTFEGESRDLTTFRVQGQGSAFVFAGGDSTPTTYEPGWYTNSTKMNTVRNMSFFREFTVTPGGVCIDLNHANNTIIENVRIISNGGRWAVGIRVTMDYVTIRNCFVQSSSGPIDTGISLDKHRQLIFPNEKGTFIAGPVDGARIEKTTIEGCGIGIFEHGGQACNLIADNTFGRCITTGIKVYADNDDCIWGLTIRGNQMEGNGFSQHNEIWIERVSPFLAKGITIQGNFFNIQDKTTLKSPYDITDPTQLAQCTFINNVYRIFGGTSGGIQVSEGLSVGVLPVVNTTASPMLSAGSFGLKVTTVTGNYTAGNEGIILVNTGTATIALPAASTVTGRMYYIKKITAGGAITIDGNGAETIDGVQTKQLISQYQGVQIISNGTSWFIVSLK